MGHRLGIAGAHHVDVPNRCDRLAADPSEVTFCAANERRSASLKGGLTVA